MSEMTTPVKFIAATALTLFVGTVVATAATKSIVVFVVGIAASMVLPRAMIGDGRK